MTTRARVYLGAAGVRHFTIGAFLLVAPWLFSAAAFIPIFNLLPLGLWAVIMTLEGILCAVAAGLRNGPMARLSIGISAVLTLVLGVGLTIGIIASWVQWVDVVGWDTVWHLLQERPVTYPLELLIFGPAPPSPFLPIIMLTLTVKDFVICAQPLRVPLEAEWVKRWPRRQ